MIKVSQIVQWDPLQAGSCVILIIYIVLRVLLVVHEDALGSFCAPQAWSHPHQEKTLEHPLDCKEIQPSHPKGHHSWVFIGRTDAKVETPILWPPDVKKWLIVKDPDAGKDRKQEEKMTTEDEMVGWHHWLNGHGFEQSPGVGDGQGGLACCSPCSRKQSDTTEWLNGTDFSGYWIQWTLEAF